ncbi:hypothetical protein [Mucilaginibacter ginsenosidivorax]|uniref:PilZ domain-containing protein n=1 Tax=Mucilaginibacter ginsenosidivorax TaxID=862126 RepID=A0A5B8W1U0_9SPHI|nr:hypothetical protein [Mucilaginibacter ginsenosidivorax]QEC76816.1 hypothetical protein FSB76_12985 [Mucilaginibacter ginsenosidivorax]
MHGDNRVNNIKCGSFLLQDYFRITGRGLVVAGELVDGTISPGNLICICHLIIKVKSVEFVRRSGGELIGLMLDIADDKGIEILVDKLKDELAHEKHPAYLILA